MGRTEHGTKIMHAQIGINAFDNLINLSFQSIDFFIVGNDRVHVDDKIDSHLCTDLTFDIINDIMADQNVNIGRNFCMNRCKGVSRAIAVNLEVMHSDNAVVGGNTLTDFTNELRVWSLTKQRITCFDDKFDARNSDEDSNSHTHPSINWNGGEVINDCAD